MADWIPWTKGLPTKPEVARIAFRLGLRGREGLCVAACAVMAVWEWVDSQAEDGETVEGATPEIVDVVAALDGLAEAMEEVGWLEVADRGLRFPNLTRYLTNTAKCRAQARDRMRRYRKRKAEAGP